MKLENITVYNRKTAQEEKIFKIEFDNLGIASNELNLSLRVRLENGRWNVPSQVLYTTDPLRKFKDKKDGWYFTDHYVVIATEDKENKMLKLIRNF